MKKQLCATAQVLQVRPITRTKAKKINRKEREELYGKRISTSANIVKLSLYSL